MHNRRRRISLGDHSQPKIRNIPIPATKHFPASPACNGRRPQLRRYRLLRSVEPAGGPHAVQGHLGLQRRNSETRQTLTVRRNSSVSLSSPGIAHSTALHGNRIQTTVTPAHTGTTPRAPDGRAHWRRLVGGGRPRPRLPRTPPRPSSERASAAASARSRSPEMGRGEGCFRARAPTDDRHGGGGRRLADPSAPGHDAGGQI